MRPLLPLVVALAGGCTMLTQADWDRRVDPDDDGFEFPNDCDDRDPSVLGPGLAYSDRDGDGEGNPDIADYVCPDAKGWSQNNDDCDDTDPAVNTRAVELCDLVDNDCNGTVDDGFPAAPLHRDADQDGFGDPTGEHVCDRTGYVGNGADCDDTNAAVNPTANEECDGVDNDCDGSTDENGRLYADADGDGHGDLYTRIGACTPTPGFVANSDDCDDTNPAVYPGAVELCDDGLDDDCDGVSELTTWYLDADGDGDGDPSSAFSACPAPAGGVATGEDCDDTNAGVSSLATEVCTDGLDNDCDGWVDGGTFYPDADGDGLGTGSGSTYCTVPRGYSRYAYDCNDGSAAVPKVVDALGGSDLGDGSITHPYSTIAKAVSASAGCILLLPGTYSENVDLSTLSTTLSSTGGASNTVIASPAPTCDADGLACAPVLTIGAGPLVTVSDVTLSGGTGKIIPDPFAGSGSYLACGGGIYTAGTLNLFNVNLVGSQLPTLDAGAGGTLGSAGGGLCIDAGGGAIWTGGAASRNFAESGGGIAVIDGGLVIAKVAIAENEATEGAGLWLGDTMVSGTQLRFACNTATGEGGAIYLADSFTDLQLSQIDLALDSASGGAIGGEVAGVTGSIARLSGVAMQASSSAPGLGTEGTLRIEDSVLYNDAGETVGDGVAESGTLEASPLFSSVVCDGDPDNDSFTLQAGSPAIDAGPSSATDTDGSRADAGSNGGSGGSW